MSCSSEWYLQCLRHRYPQILSALPEQKAGLDAIEKGENHERRNTLGSDMYEELENIV